MRKTQGTPTAYVRGRVVLHAADAAGAETPEKPKQRRLEILAYTGGALTVSGWPLPVVVDLRGLDVRPGVKLPVLINHADDPEHTLGQMESVQVMPPDRVMATGWVTGTSTTAKPVLANNDAGHEYQASIGIRVTEREVIDRGESANVNGRTHVGPVLIARQSALCEISFCNLGADDQTSARIAARAAKGFVMTFELWLKARGLTIDGLAQDKVDALKTEYAAFLTATGIADDGDEPQKNTQDKKAPEKLAARAAADDTDDSDEEVLRARRQALAAESQRLAAINKLSAMADFKNAALTEEKGQTLEARAIDQGWSAEKYELELVRASRPRVAAAIVSGNAVDAQVLEAAALRAGGYSAQQIEKTFKPQTLEVVDKRFKRGIGLKELVLEAAWRNGCGERSLNVSNLPDVLRAAFSTAAISGILSNTANKFLVNGFMAVNQAWRRIAAKRSANDFKAMTIYRMTGEAIFEKVGPAGQIKHGTLGESSYTNQVSTFARMLAITRQDLINDDLGALTDVPRRLGYGAGIAFNKTFWTEFMDNSAFFASGNNNYISGATTTLTAAGLQAGVLKFRKQTTEEGDPIELDPSLLLVPPDLEIAAAELYRSTNVNTGGSASTEKVPNANVFAGRYEPIVSPYLSNTNYTGYSATAWYLLCDPAGGVAVIEAAFLNGQENPTIETAEADFSTLGINMRGYGDWGVAKAEKRAGVKSKGAA